MPCKHSWKYIKEEYDECRKCGKKKMFNKAEATQSQAGLPVDSPVSGSIAWISVKNRLPEQNQYVLVHRPSRNKTVAMQTIHWWHGDEDDYTHWAELEIPKQ
jgi:hypothetical protein